MEWLELFVLEVLGPFALRCAFIIVVTAANLAATAFAFREIWRVVRGQG